jgi:hypothetical protein
VYSALIRDLSGRDVVRHAAPAQRRSSLSAARRYNTGQAPGAVEGNVNRIILWNLTWRRSTGV